MRTHLHSFFAHDELKTAALHPPLDFTKRLPVLSIRALNDALRPPEGDRTHFKSFKTALYDNVEDPRQLNPLDLPDVETRLKEEARSIPGRHGATPTFLDWVGFEPA